MAQPFIWMKKSLADETRQIEEQLTALESERSTMEEIISFAHLALLDLCKGGTTLVLPRSKSFKIAYSRRDCGTHRKCCSLNREITHLWQIFVSFWTRLTDGQEWSALADDFRTFLKSHCPAVG